MAATTPAASTTITTRATVRSRSPRRQATFGLVVRPGGLVSLMGRHRAGLGAGDWHASEEGQQERRLVATQDRDALNQLVDPAKACGLLDGVPGVKTLGVSAPVSELEGTTQREARDAWRKREGMPWLSDLPESAG